MGSIFFVEYVICFGGYFMMYDCVVIVVDNVDVEILVF